MVVVNSGFTDKKTMEVNESLTCLEIWLRLYCLSISALWLHQIWWAAQNWSLNRLSRQSAGLFKNLFLKWYWETWEARLWRNEPHFWNNKWLYSTKCWKFFESQKKNIQAPKGQVFCMELLMRFRDILKVCEKCLSANFKNSFGPAGRKCPKQIKILVILWKLLKTWP